MMPLPDISTLSADLQIQIEDSYAAITGKKANGIPCNEHLEKIADLLNQSGFHSESRRYYAACFDETNAAINKARILRKISGTYNAQREFLKATQASEEALVLMRVANANEENVPEFFEGLTACAYANYFISNATRLQELVTEMRVYFASVTDKNVRLRFYFVVMLSILLRNRWYMLPEEAITHSEFYLQLAIETNDWNTIATAYSGLGFCHLWREEFHLCRKNFELAFDQLQNRNYDLVLTAQVYTTVSFRMQNNVSMCEQWAMISKQVAEQTNNQNYLGLTYGNIAWVHVKRKNFLYAEEYARKSLAICIPLSNPMLYLAIFPLLKCLLLNKQYEEAGKYAYLLLHPALKGFPGSLNEKIAQLNEAWIRQDSDQPTALEDVVAEAEITNYF
jgi:hypothetical protein